MESSEAEGNEVNKNKVEKYKIGNSEAKES